MSREGFLYKRHQLPPKIITYVAVQSVLDEKMLLVSVGDYRANVCLVFSNLKIALAGSEATQADVVSSVLCLKNLNHDSIGEFVKGIY